METRCPESAVWRPGPWSWRQIVRDRLLDRWPWFRQWGRSLGTYWPGGPKPLICSGCGCIRPIDAIALVRAGWEVTRLSRPDQRFLQPAGHRAALRQMFAGGPMEGYVRAPMPSVRLSVRHFSDEETVAFNAALVTHEGWVFPSDRRCSKPAPVTPKPDFVPPGQGVSS